MAIHGVLEREVHMKRVFTLLASALLVASALPASVGATVAGAGFTTFVDASKCLDSPNGVDCNNYVSKDDVYMSGGSSAGGVSNGSYFFAVLTPGSQNGGFLDGADGNLSDTIAGSTTGDNGTGDDVSCRTFHVTSHEIDTYSPSNPPCTTGAHLTGYNPGPRFVIQLLPYDDTDNAGDVYILAICQVGATSSSQCKFDAFRVPPEGHVTPFGVVSGMKYYDANENGQWDAGEVGIPDWPIDFTDGISGTVATDSNGEFSLSLVADTYTFQEQVANSPWVQTGNTVDQTSSSGGSSASLSSFVYTVNVVDGGLTIGLNFGNVCRLTPGGRTIGFWSNKNGQALLTAADFTGLTALNLRNANGTDRDFTASLSANKTALKNWLLSATATNMAYMLSAQLAATYLNVAHGFTVPSIIVDGSRTVAQEIDYANSLLANPIVGGPFNGQNGSVTVAASALRTEQERVKNILDKINNGGAFTQPTPDTCPTPVFP
jgi:hypothetical protein